MTLALLGRSDLGHTKNRGGRPSKISKGWGPEDKDAWMFYRACLVLDVVERARMNGKTRKEAALSAISEWKRRHPMGKLSSTEVDNILREYQPENTPKVSLRIVEHDVPVEWEIVDGEIQLTGRWETRRVLTMRYAERPPYPKRGSGKKASRQFSKKFAAKKMLS